MTTAASALTRREPKQRRSRRTVDDVLDAVQLVVKRHGTRAITTNRIAEAAGVSVGSLYQYFPDKRAIFAALHDRHVDDVRQVMEETVAAGISASLRRYSTYALLAPKRNAERMASSAVLPPPITATFFPCKSSMGSSYLGNS